MSVQPAEVGCTWFTDVPPEDEPPTDFGPGLRLSVPPSWESLLPYGHSVRQITRVTRPISDFPTLDDLIQAHILPRSLTRSRNGGASYILIRRPPTNDLYLLDTSKTYGICCKCGLAFKWHSTCTNHQFDCTPPRLPARPDAPPLDPRRVHKCTECVAAFSTLVDWVAHMSHQHPWETDEVGMERLQRLCRAHPRIFLRCPTCGKRSKNGPAYDAHLRTHGASTSSQ